MQILVEVPAALPDAIQSTPQQFIQQAKMAMGRVQFLGELHRYGVAVIDLEDGELAEDIINA